MTANKIASAKEAFDDAIGQEVEEIHRSVSVIAARCREDANETRGMNGLRESFNQIANTLEAAMQQATETATEAKAWLVGNKIVEHVSDTADE